MQASNLIRKNITKTGALYMYTGALHWFWFYMVLQIPRTDCGPKNKWKVDQLCSLFSSFSSKFVQNLLKIIQYIVI